MFLAAEHMWFWQSPSWNWAECWALVALLIFSLLPVDVESKSGPGDRGGKRVKTTLIVAVLNGRDGRWSTSKASALFWTYAVWFAFIAILLRTNGSGIAHAMLKDQYLALMGLPVGAAVVAKGLTQSKVESGKLATKTLGGAETNPARGLGQLVSDDSGQPDLLDLQYFGFNLILLGYFFTRFLGHQSAGLPHLPPSLVALAGVSVAGYLGKKSLQKDTAPVITLIWPAPATRGRPITIRGANLAAAQDTTEDVGVRFGRLTIMPDSIDAGDDATAAAITATVPADAPLGRTPVRVVTSRGPSSEPYYVTIEEA
jgi:hypothetical protein